MIPSGRCSVAWSLYMTQQYTRSNTTCAASQVHVWQQEGYDAFAAGQCGNGGQNLYVSRAGVLQRIFHYDCDQDGYVDLVFVNAQDMDERPAVEVIADVLGSARRTYLPTMGAYAAAVGDLNGDGIDELVLAHQHNGTMVDLHAYVYWGGDDGLTPRYRLELPAPNCRAVAVGDFDGDGHADVAFAAAGQLRIFYQHQGMLHPNHRRDYPIEVTHMCAADIDGDGYDDLYVRLRGHSPRILWGGPDGIDPDRYTIVGGDDPQAAELSGSTPGRLTTKATWRPGIVQIDGRWYVFRGNADRASLYHVTDREPVEVYNIPCEQPVCVAAGDVDADGRDELAIVLDSVEDNEAASCIYRQSQGTWSPWQPIPTVNARGVAIADLDGNGYGDVAIAQGHTAILNSTHSLVYTYDPAGDAMTLRQFSSHDATDVLLARTMPTNTPQMILVNHEGNRVRGDVPVYIYHGGSDGYHPQRRTELPGWSASDSVLADLNDSGWPDLIVCNSSENAIDVDPGAFVYRNNQGTFRADDTYVLPALRPWGCTVGDFRKSGYLDVIFCGISFPGLVYFCNGPDGFDIDNPRYIMLDEKHESFPRVRGKWHTPEEYPEGAEYREQRFILAADLNGNGYLDLVLSLILHDRTMILWGGPEGFSRTRSTVLTAEGVACANAADLNGNGYLDLVIGSYHCKSNTHVHDSYVYIYWGGDDGFREDRRTQLPVHAADSIAIADFNNDGILDIFVGNYKSDRVRDLDSYIFWGTAQGVYSPQNCERLFSHSASGVIAADFNEDGWTDIALACHKSYGNHQAESQIWWNGPSGFLRNNITWLPTLGPHGMITVDPGNIMDRSNEEIFTSSAQHMHDPVRIVSVAWQADTPIKTWVRAQVRIAETYEALQNAAWQGPDGKEDAWFTDTNNTSSIRQTGCWIQYRLALGATNGGSSPRVHAVTLSYEYLRPGELT